MTRNQIDYAKHEEQVRSNKANEEIGRRNATSNERNAASNERNAYTNERIADETARANVAREAISYEQLGETKRANLAKEFETNRANVARETETHRANVVREKQNLASIGIAQGTLNETTRSHLANEINDMRKTQQGWFATLFGRNGILPGLISIGGD